MRGMPALLAAIGQAHQRACAVRRLSFGQQVQRAGVFMQIDVRALPAGAQQGGVHGLAGAVGGMHDAAAAVAESGM